MADPHPYAGLKKPASIPQKVWDLYIQRAEKLAIANKHTPEQIAQAVKQFNSADGQRQLTTSIQQQFPNEIAAAQDEELAEKSAGQQAQIETIAGSGGGYGRSEQFINEQLIPELDKLRFAQGGVFGNDQAALQLYDEARKRGQGKWDALAGQARESADRYNNQSRALQQALVQGYGELDESDRAALEQYMGETDPLMQQLTARGWGDDVQADPEGLAAQRRALDMAFGDVTEGGKNQQDVMERYKALSTPEVTAQERYLAEIARRNFEAQDRSSREAVMQNLAQRGLDSGTLQIAGNLAAQERLGQDRTLAELGIQANAVGRGMQALEGYGRSAQALRSGNQAANQIYGNQAGALRTANDALAMFNKEGSQIAQRFQDTYAQDEATRTGNLARDRNLTQRDTNYGVERRLSDTNKSGQTALHGEYIREDDARREGWDAADRGYESDTGYAGRFADMGQRAWDRQLQLVNAAGGVSGQFGSAAVGGDNLKLDALKLGLGLTEGERALLAAKRLT